MVKLYRKLFSCFPHPESGGQFRQSNILVLGAKFGANEYNKIQRKNIIIILKMKVRREFVENRADRKIETGSNNAKYACFVPATLLPQNPIIQYDDDRSNAKSYQLL